MIQTMNWKGNTDTLLKVQHLNGQYVDKIIIIFSHGGL